MARINKVAHVVLNVTDVEAATKFYAEALGMEVMSYNPERHMSFLSFGTQHHDFALFKAPEGLEHSERGLNHVAMQIEGGVEELNQLYRRLLDCGATIDGIFEHNVSKSVYFFDPDGNRLEIFCEVMEMEEARRVIREPGGSMKPFAFETATV